MKAVVDFFRHYICTVPKPLNILIILSTTILFLKLIWLNQIPEFFSGGSEMGEIFEAILTSIIASYFFYFVLVHYKEVEQKKALYPFIKRWSKGILTDVNRVIDIMAKRAGRNIDNLSITQPEIDAIFSSINPEACEAPTIIEFRRANWREFLYINGDQVKKNLEKLSKDPLLLDSDLYRVIIKLQDSEYLWVTDFYKNHTLDHLNGFSHSFGEVLFLSQELSKIAEKNSSRYGISD